MESKRIKWNFKNIYRPKPLTNRKLYTTITIILRNTIAGKTAIEPVNTFNSKIITILNP